MHYFNHHKIFSISNDIDFINITIDIFNYQYNNCLIYQRYCNYRHINPSKIDSLDHIPFLPISVFKQFEIIHKKISPRIIFTSSGTSSDIPSKHLVGNPEIYIESFMKGFTRIYGSPSQYSILALLPSYLEREGSSLVYMVKHLIEMSKNETSGFYLHNVADLLKTLVQNETRGQKTILIGVSFALLDLAQKVSLSLKNTIIIETGGMKGRGKEITRDELHSILKNGFGVNQIHSEYGMTELLSQAYSTGNGIFSCPPWMQVKIRDLYDPFSFLPKNIKGGINVIDLANIYSCSFIETQDIGTIVDTGCFEITGRFDHSEIRGCNLLL